MSPLTAITIIAPLALGLIVGYLAGLRHAHPATPKFTNRVGFYRATPAAVMSSPIVTPDDESAAIADFTYTDDDSPSPTVVPDTAADLAPSLADLVAASDPDARTRLLAALRERRAHTAAETMGMVAE